MTPRPTVFPALLCLFFAACGGATPAGSPPPAGVADAPSNRAEPIATPASDAADASAANAMAPDAGTAVASATGADGGPPAPAADAGPTFDFALVEQIVKQHKDSVRAACWDKSKSTEKAYAGTMSVRVAPTGKVVSVEVDGTDKPASQCIEKQVKAWTFPPPNGTATINVPIRLRRD